MLGGMTAVYLLVPAIDAMTMRLKPRLLVCVCLILMVCFTADLVYSFINPNKGDGITNELDMINPTEVAVFDENTDAGRT